MLLVFVVATLPARAEVAIRSESVIANRVIFIAASLSSGYEGQTRDAVPVIHPLACEGSIERVRSVGSKEENNGTLRLVM